MLKSIKIGPRLICGFALVSIIAVGTVSLGIRSIRQISGQNKQIMNQILVPMTSILQVQSCLDKTEPALRDYLRRNDNPSFLTAQDYIGKLRSESMRLSELLVDGSVQSTAVEFKSAADNYLLTLNSVMNLQKSGATKEATVLLDNSAPALAQTRRAFKSLAEAQNIHAGLLADQSAFDGEKAVVYLLGMAAIALLIAWVAGIILTMSIVKPLHKTVFMIKEMSQGRLSTRLDLDGKDELTEMAAAVNAFADDLQHATIRTIKKISDGDTAVSVPTKGEGDEISPALNQTAETLNALMQEIKNISSAAKTGNLKVRGQAGKFHGSYREIIQGINETLDAVVGPLNMAASYVDRISRGEIPPQIAEPYQGDFNTLKNNLNKCITAINAMIDDVNKLAQAGVEGQLFVRADITRHEGDYRKIVQGINETMDSVIAPLTKTADYMDKISKGNIPPVINKEYKGDFNTIKNSLNKCIIAVNNMITDVNALAAAAQEGRLNMRADAERHEGDYRKIVEGINGTLDALIKPLSIAAERVDRIAKGSIPQKISEEFSGDFNTLKVNVNKCIDAVNNMMQDVNMLAAAAQEGRLDARANAMSHEGDYRKIVQGINDTLNALTLPINEATVVLEQLAMRDLTARVSGEYKGDLAKIKEAVNLANENLDKSLQQVAMASQQVASAAEQISRGSQNLAQGASMQASSLEQVSSGLQEMTSMTKQNASNAREAKALAENAKETVIHGVGNMKKLSDAIERIKKSADATAKIIKTIDEIAFQTNLLALNAAVEAARAGEAGKGFAVVAEEVRALALRSADAAKNTANMIEESVKNAETGVVLNQEVMGDLTNINTQAQKVSEVVSEISTASEQQSDGIEQINSAIQHMGQTTQDAAANSEESASAAEQLNTQAKDMRTMVETFQITSSPVTHKAQPQQYLPSGSDKQKPEMSQTRKPLLERRPFWETKPTMPPPQLDEDAAAGQNDDFMKF